MDDTNFSRSNAELPEALEAAATTCSTKPPKCSRTIIEDDVPLNTTATRFVTKSNCHEKQIVQIALSIWLLRSKLHRKEFRRKA